MLYNFRQQKDYYFNYKRGVKFLLNNDEFLFIEDPHMNLASMNLEKIMNKFVLPRFSKDTKIELFFDDLGDGRISVD